MPHERPEPRGMNRKRLVALVEFLLDLPPPLFDFSHFVRVPEGEPGARQPGAALQAGGGCGTTACAVGWMPAVFPRLADWRANTWGKTDAVVLLPTQRHIRLLGSTYTASRARNLDAASIVFNLTEREAEWLFLPCDHEDDHCLDLTCDSDGPCVRPTSDATKEQVANHILAMVEGPPKEFEVWCRLKDEWEEW